MQMDCSLKDIMHWIHAKQFLDQSEIFTTSGCIVNYLNTEATACRQSGVASCFRHLVDPQYGICIVTSVVFGHRVSVVVRRKQCGMGALWKCIHSSVGTFDK